MIMGNLGKAFADAELLADLATRRAQGGLHASRGGQAQGEEVHCFDPWFIAKAEQLARRRAEASLKREGFEVWYPAGRLLTSMPQRMLTANQRHARQKYLRESMRLPYGDYVFLRRLFGSYDLSRLYDLSGVIGLCMIGEQPAMLQDFEVEMLRLAEFDGVFDRCEALVSEKQLQLAKITRTKAADERWNKQPVTHSVLDESKRRLYFVEAFGRITRVVTG
jgi:hypothetical protein